VTSLALWSVDSPKDVNKNRDCGWESSGQDSATAFFYAREDGLLLGFQTSFVVTYSLGRSVPGGAPSDSKTIDPEGSSRGNVCVLVDLILR
jgi:hypothetical protein